MIHFPIHIYNLFYLLSRRMRQNEDKDSYYINKTLNFTDPYYNIKF